MRFNEKEFRLAGRHFVANIALDENLPGGLAAVARDPRKLRIKPAAYVGRIEEVAPGCKLVKVGDRVVIERWTWGQLDLDDERILAKEDHLLILNDDTPAPKVIVFSLLEKKAPVTTLALPASFEMPETPSHCGEVVASADSRFEVGEIYWFQKSDQGQFCYADGRMAFRNNGYAEILARGWSAAYRQKKAAALGMDAEEFEVVSLASGFVAID